MVLFTEHVVTKEDHLFVQEDPARVYRGLRDLLTDEVGVDRIEEGKMEFNVEKPKDRVRMHAFKEKSPYTEIRFGLSLKLKRPRDVYRFQRPDDIMKARLKIEAELMTNYPGGETVSWLPHGTSEWKDHSMDHSGLRAEEKTSYHRSKLYRLLVGIWYNYLYSGQVDKYEDEAEESVIRIQNLMREQFGVEKTITKTGKSEYTPPWQ